MVRNVTAALMGDPSHGASVITEALGPKPAPPMARERLAISTDKKLGAVEPPQIGFDEEGGGYQMPGKPAFEPSGNSGELGPPDEEARPRTWEDIEDAGLVPSAGPKAALRPIAPMEFDGLNLAPIPTGEPLLEWIAPADLLVNDAYQRELGPKGLAQVRRIAENWDWRRVKPVIVAMTDRGLEVIDGQHTAIAAATRGLEKIPAMVVDAAETQDRAGAFVGQNRDRIALSAMQLHHAAVAAGDPEAVTVAQVCQRAGVNLVVAYWGGYAWQPGDCIAVGAINALIGRRGALRAREIMQALVSAGLAPIAASDIKAAEYLFTDPDFAPELEPLPEGGADLAAAIRILGAGWQREAKELAATKCLPVWKAQAGIWFRKCRKRRKAA